MRIPTRSATASLLLIAALVLASAAAAQEAPGCIGLEVQPARTESDLENSHEYDVSLRNCEDDALRVTLTVEELGHDLDGAPSFTESDEAAGALLLEGADSFTLAPGDVRVVHATAKIPSGERSLYAGIVAEFEPAAGGTVPAVEVRSRIASMLLMRGPKPWVQKASVVDVGLLPSGEKSYSVFAAVKDTGDVHINPTGVVEIRKDGTLLDRVRLQGQTILPTCGSGCARRIVGSWRPPVRLAGDIDLTAIIDNPPARATKVVRFSEGKSLRPAGRIENLIAKDLDGPLVTFELVNTGTADLLPVVELTATQDRFERAREILTGTEPLKPGARRSLEWRPELTDGTYLITARAKQGDLLLDEKIAGLRVGRVSAGESSSSGGRGAVFAAAALLLIVMLGLLFFFLWKRRRRDEGPSPTAPREASRTGAR